MAARSRADSAAGKKKTSKRDSDSIHDHATHLMHEAEQTAEDVIGQVRGLFDSLTRKISSIAHPAPAAPSASGAPAGQGASAILDHVREAGEASVRAVGDGFESVRQRIVARVSAARSGAAPAGEGDTGTSGARVVKKTAASKKAAKKAASRKTVQPRKTAAKKPVSKKKTVAKKKPAAKRKPVAKKKAATRAGTKKPASGARARKKSPAR